MDAACGFCGHSDAPESLRVELKETIADLIREKMSTSSMLETTEGLIAWFWAFCRNCRLLFQ